MSWKLIYYMIHQEHAILVDVHDGDLCRSVWDYSVLTSQSSGASPYIIQSGDNKSI